MNKTIIKNERINEEYQVIKHPSGLAICLYPMKGYSSTYALFSARYGSVDTTFKTSADADFVTVPEGIAHYLEHKLFESEECDAFQLFADTGANANAFTSFDKTAYLFSSTQHFEKNLEILLKFVQEPYFTDENVEKEQGIIGQEIKMYDDDPGWRVFFNGLQALYHNNPVRIDIAGTVESISHINKELLYRCYNTFYNLNNMSLCIAGNFDVDKALELCDKYLKKSEDIGLEAVVPEEPYEVNEKIIRQKLSCSIPLFNILFKFPNYVGYENVRNYVVYNVLFETILGSTSDAYHKMYKSGFINDSFNVGVLNGRGFFACTAEGEAAEPEKVYEFIKEALTDAKKNGINEADFKNVKKKTYGQLLMQFNKVDNVARNMMEAHFNDVNLFDMIEIAADISMDDMNKALRQLDVENSVISIIDPA